MKILLITLLFSIPAHHHPRATVYHPPKWTCKMSDGGAYRICCTWNDQEGAYLGKQPNGTPVYVGAWDCTGTRVS